MKSKRRIAVLIALMLAMPVGIAALEETASSDSAEATETPAVQAETPAVQAESTAQPAELSAPPMAESVVEAVVASAPVERLVRATPSDTFPVGSLDSNYFEPLPSQIAYFERLEQERRHLVARGDVFPEGTEVEWRMLPTQIAYFDGLERQHLASAEQMTQTDAMSDSAAATGESRNPLRVAWDYVSGLFKRMGAAISGWGSSSESAVQ